jgi:hypothetical protein
MPDRDVLVILPTYNERENLDELSTGFARTRRARHPDHRRRLARWHGAHAAAAGLPLGGIDVLQRGARRGIGSAYRDGSSRPRARLPLARHDGRDLSHEPRYRGAAAARGRRLRDRLALPPASAS